MSHGQRSLDADEALRDGAHGPGVYGTAASPPPDSAIVSVKIHGYMRLSRHARNAMRLYRISSDDVEAAVINPAGRDLDDRGNARLTGETRDGRPILVVVARGAPDFVITVFLRS